MKEMQQGGRRMPTTSVRMVAVIAMACLVLAATGARGNVEVGDVGEYWQKRTQEARLRNHGAPLHDLVAAATRFHQDLLHRANSRRSALELDAEAPTQQMTTSTPAQAEASTVEGGDDHQLVQDPAIIRN